MGEHYDQVEIDPAVFLIRTCARLAASAGTDGDVAAILTTMLTAPAGPTAAIIDARESLRALAMSRAVGASDPVHLE